MPSAKKTLYSRRHRGKDYPTVTFFHLLHDSILEETGGRPGILKPELLESALEKPVVTVGGRDAYETLFMKVAAIGHEIAHGHVFQDANKRTAIETIRVTLAWNGYRKQPDQRAVELAVLLTAAGFLNAEGLKMASLFAYGLELSNADL